MIMPTDRVQWEYKWNSCSRSRYSIVLLEHTLLFLKRERDTDLPFTNSFPKCPQLPELGQSKARSLKFFLGFHVSTRTQALGVVSDAFCSVESCIRTGAVGTQTGVTVYVLCLSAGSGDHILKHNNTLKDQVISLQSNRFGNQMQCVILLSQDIYIYIFKISW